MTDPHLVVLKPIITEKSTFATEKQNAYSFKVSRDANKIQIREAVEQIFDVKVRAVNTVRQRGKYKRVGRNFGRTKDYKKAIVTLRPGYNIDLTM